VHSLRSQTGRKRVTQIVKPETEDLRLLTCSFPRVPEGRQLQTCAGITENMFVCGSILPPGQNATLSDARPILISIFKWLQAKNFTAVNLLLSWYRIFLTKLRIDPE